MRQIFNVLFFVFSSYQCGPVYSYDILPSGYRSTIPVTQDLIRQPWWMPRHNSVLKRHAREAVDILWIGDSITHAWDHPKEGKEIFDRNYAHRKTSNLGFSGDKTENVLWRIMQGEVDNINPKLAVVMIGTNNTGLTKDPPNEISAGVMQVIDALHAKQPNMKILLLAIFPCDEPGSFRRINNSQANELLKEAVRAKDYVEFRDIGEKFLDSNERIKVNMIFDGTHLAPDGFVAWAESIEDAIERALD